jgi:hypothetical protein
MYLGSVLKQDHALRKGKDFYARMLVFQLLSLVLAFIVLILPGPEQSQAVTIDSGKISDSNFPLDTVLLPFTLFILIILDRVIYLRRSLPLKMLMQIVATVLPIGYFFWKSGSFSATFRLWLCAHGVYLYLSALQINEGYPTIDHGRFLHSSPDVWTWLLCYTYQLIPFALELGALVDWSCTRTTLVWYDWIKLEWLMMYIYYRWVDISFYGSMPLRLLGRIKGDERPGYYKFYQGWLLLLGLIIVIWGPLLIATFATYLPTTERQLGSVTLEVSIVVRLVGESDSMAGGSTSRFVFKLLTVQHSASRDAAMHIRHGLESQRFDSIKNVQQSDPRWGQLRSVCSAMQTDAPVCPSLGRNQKQYSITELRMQTDSGEVWAISPPAFEALSSMLTSTNRTVALLFAFSFELEQKADVQEAAATIPYIAEKPLEPEERLQLQRMISNHSQSGSMQFAFPQPVVVSLGGGPSGAIKAQVAEMMTEQVQLNFEVRSAKSWFQVRVNSTKDDASGCWSDGIGAFCGLRLLVISQDVLATSLESFLSYSLLGLYGGIVYAVHSVIALPMSFPSGAMQILVDGVLTVTCLQLFRTYTASIPLRCQYDTMHSVGKVRELCLDILRAR